MKFRKLKALGMGAAVLALLVVSGCEEKQKVVVVYTAVDQVYSDVIFREFEEETGIRVKAVYDTEANKTTGLVNRILAEKDKPVCDVFWNNEFIQTIALKEEGMLQPYYSKEASDIPDAYKDPEGYWTAFGGRARVMLVNTDLLSEEEYPDSVYDLVNGSFDGKEIALAYPMFGTTRTQAAALYAYMGPEEGREFFEKVADCGIQIVDGNSVTKDMAAAGQVAIGYTDTDDAKEAIEDGAPVAMVFPDQGEDGMGTLITPNTVSMIAGASHTEEAKQFIDYVVTRQMEEHLMEMGFFDLSVREDGTEDGFSVKGMDISLNDIYKQLEQASVDMQEIFSQAH